MKLRTQLSIFGVLGVLPALLVACIGFVSTKTLSSAVNEATVAGKAMQASQQADMMHDAIRSDAQMAMMGANENNAAMIQEAERHLQEHGQEFLAQTKLVGTMPLNDETKDALNKVQPVLEKYLTDANKLIEVAKTSSGSLQTSMGALSQSFKPVIRFNGGAFWQHQQAR